MVTVMTRDQLVTEVKRRGSRLKTLKTFGRGVEGFQIIALLTFGQYLYTGGAQQLSAKHWESARAFFGGYQGVGLSLMIIACLGLIGLLTLGFTRRDTLYSVIMWVYSLLAFVWFVGIGITHHLAQSGSTGLWSLGFAGFFFLTIRIATTIASGIEDDDPKENSAQPTARS